MLLNVMVAPALPTLSGLDPNWIMKGHWSNRLPCVPGVDVLLSEDGTRLQVLKALQMTVRFSAARITVPSTLYLRIYVTFPVKIELWGGNAAFQVDYAAGWHAIKLEYFANGQNRYTIDGVVRYTGTIRGAIYFGWAGAGTILGDNGNRGGVLPAGCEWW